MERENVLNVELVSQKMEDTCGNSQHEPPHQVKGGASSHQNWSLDPQRIRAWWCDPARCTTLKKLNVFRVENNVDYQV